MIALFPGSFDPVTLGHKDIIKRASMLFDRLIVAVMNNISKKYVFSIEERTELIAKTVGCRDNVEIYAFTGLLSDFFFKTGASVVIRGLRNTIEYEHELQYAQAYRNLDTRMETLFLPSDPNHVHISSGMVREAAVFGGDLSLLVPDAVIDDIIKKFSKQGDH